MDVLDELARLTDRDGEVAPTSGSEVFRRGRARVRRRRALGGGGALAVVAALVVAFLPGLGPGVLRIDDAPPMTSAPAIPDGWQLVEVGDASFAVPSGYEVRDVPPGGPSPCWNEGPIVFVAEAHFGDQPGCRAFGNDSPIVIGARISGSERRQRARESTFLEAVDVNGYAAVVHPGVWPQYSSDPRRTVTYLVDDLDLYLQLRVTREDFHLVDEIVATIGPRGAERASAEAGDAGASAEAGDASASAETPVGAGLQVGSDTCAEVGLSDAWTCVAVADREPLVVPDLEVLDVEGRDDTWSFDEQLRRPSRTATG